MILQYVFLLYLAIAVHSLPGNGPKYNDGGELRFSGFKNTGKPLMKWRKGNFDRYISGEFGNRPSEMTSMLQKFSMPEECTRTCVKDEKPRYCYYHFTMEHYVTMGKICEQCKPNNTNQLSNVPQCQCVEADGFERGMLSINRMLPGPSIQVCKNDKVIVDVHNAVDGSEVSLHWHGMWQQGSQYYDGVPFLTQCPIVSGTTFRYQFVASNPGTHFYHSHSGLHKIDGQYGSLIVREPRGVDPHMDLYDEDLPTHVIVLSDWLHEMSSARFPGRRVGNFTGQLPHSVLINGKGQWTNPATNQSTPVQIESFTVQPGKRYRFRLINSFSSVCPAQLTIEAHDLQLIAQDGEAVKPAKINTIFSSSGERVDFVLSATRRVGAYWIQVRATGECRKGETHQVAILRYDGGPAVPYNQRPQYQPGLPSGRAYNDPDAKCAVQSESATVCASHLTSVKQIPKEILKPKPDIRIQLPYRFHQHTLENLFEPGKYSRFLTTAGGTHVISVIDGISFKFPRVPPLSMKVNPNDTCNRNNRPKNCDNQAYCTCPHTHHIEKGAVVEVIVYDDAGTNGPELAHPFHLHGYAFHLLKIGRLPEETTSNSISKLINEHQKIMASGKQTQPPGKDTISVTKGGYVIFRFKADNPGWWLFHCHFLYHVAAGMNVVFHVGEVNDLPPVPPMFPTCASYTPEVV